jgi:RNA polymerase sigma factor (sigma-70 family)
MADAPLAVVLRHIRKLTGTTAALEPSDGQLLRRFAACRDEEAFQALMSRHGPMVLGVCRRLLRHGQDAEDVFQATFLLLAQKAGSIRKQESVGSWLHGVARRLALRARVRQARFRTCVPREDPGRQPDPALEAAWRELRGVLDEEFRRLPPKYCDALVLCYLEGRTHEEAARELGQPLGTVKSLLARGRELLRRRLARRGLTLSAAGFAAVVVTESAPAAVPPALAASVLSAAIGTAAAGAVPAEVAALLQGGARTMSMTRLLWVPAALFFGCLLGVGACLLAYQALAARAPTDDPIYPQAAEPPPADPGSFADPLPPGGRLRLGDTRLRHKESVTAVAFAPDGKLLATGGGDQCIRLWDPAAGRQLRMLPAKEGQIGAIAFSGDGKVLTATVGETVRRWEVGTGKELPPMYSKVASTLASLALAADGSAVAAASTSAFHLWGRGGGKERVLVPLPASEAACLAFTADGKGLLSATWQDSGCTVRQWDPTTDRELRTLELPNAGALRLRPLAFSPGGTTLAVERVAQVRRPKGGGFEVFAEYQVVLVDPLTGKERQRLEGQRDVIWAAAFSADGKSVAWIGMDCRAGVADVETGKVRRRLQGPAGCTRPDGRNTLAFSPDGKLLAAVGSSAAVQVWDLATGRPALGRSAGHDDAVTDLAFSADGRALASAGADRTIRLWNLGTGKERLVLAGHGGAVLGLAFSPDGSTLASADQDSGIRLWDTSAGREVRRIQAVERTAGIYFGISPLAFTPDGKTLLSWGDDRRLHHWDVATGKELRRPEPVLAGLPPAPEGRPQVIPPFKEQVVGVAFGPDARVAAVAAGSSLYLVDAATGRLLFKLPEPNAPRRLAFSPDGQLLLSGGWDKAVRLWEVATGKEVLRIGGLDYVNAVAFAPDGRSGAAATGWTQGRVHVFDVATGNELLHFEGHGAYASALAFSPDSKVLASGQRDTTVLLWDPAPARRRVGPPARDLGPKDLERLWGDLAGDDARRAHAAIWALVAAPGQAVPFLKERLHPAEPADPNHVRRLIADLNHEDFAVREAAAKQLRALGAEAEPAVRRALKESPSPEARKRLEALAAGPPTGHVPPPDALRRLRAVRALEQVGSPEAASVLEALAGGAPAALETGEARAALRRLAGKAAAPR